MEDIYRKLAHSTGVEEIKLRELKQNLPDNYIRFGIPKPNGGYRLIEEPTEPLKAIQQKLISILDLFPLHSAVYGVPGKGAIHNAKQHLGSNMILNLDVKRFFPSTDINKFNYALVGSYMDVVPLLTEAAGFCFLDERLPTGAPSSPVLANISFTPVDKEIDSLAKQYSLRYTRYMDDLSFSGEKLVKGFQKTVCEIIQDYGYRVNHKKSKLLYRGSKPQRITGISVSDGTMKVPREFKRRLRAELDKVARQNISIDDRIKGKLNYVKQISMEQYQAMTLYFERRRNRWQNGSN